jgi:hypothetical protein
LTIKKFSKRDDFRAPTVRMLAERVNYLCSNPTCGAPTVAPTVEAMGRVCIGVAAHITAAAPGGPRYDVGLSPEQRRGSENGIWLCQNCGKRVDSDDIRYSARLLRSWKSTAESRALVRLGRQRPFDRFGIPYLHVFAEPEDAASDQVLGTLGELLKEIESYLQEHGLATEMTEILDSGTSASGQRYAVAGLGENCGWEWGVLFLVAGELGWEVIARLPLHGQRGCIPQAKYILGRPGALAITHVHGYGTGVFRQSTTWYRVARGEPAALLSYPVSFYVAGWGMPFGRQLTSRLVSNPRRLISGERIRLEFTTTYGMLDGSEDQLSNLFSVDERLSLEWSADAENFVPATSEDDFAAIDRTWNEGGEQFFEHNLPRLKLLATSGNDKQKAFVRQHFPATKFP